MKRCPNCRLTNPPNALRCDCGHDLTDCPDEDDFQKEPFLSGASTEVAAVARSLVRGPVKKLIDKLRVLDSGPLLLFIAAYFFFDWASPGLASIESPIQFSMWGSAFVVIAILVSAGLVIMAINNLRLAIEAQKPDKD